MLKISECDRKFSNLVFRKNNVGDPCLMVYSRDRQKMDEERWVLNYLSTTQVKELAEYLELYLNQIES